MKKSGIQSPFSGIQSPFPGIQTFFGQKIEKILKYTKYAKYTNEKRALYTNEPFVALRLAILSIQSIQTLPEEYCIREKWGICIQKCLYARKNSSKRVILLENAFCLYTCILGL